VGFLRVDPERRAANRRRDVIATCRSGHAESLGDEAGGSRCCGPPRHGAGTIDA
jgi:hypothetical protein